MIKEAVQRGSSDNTIKPGGWLGGAVPTTIAGGGRRSVGRVCSRFHAPAGTHNGMCASDGMQVEGIEEAGGVSRMDTERRKMGIREPRMMGSGEMTRQPAARRAERRVEC